MGASRRVLGAAGELRGVWRSVAVKSTGHHTSSRLPRVNNAQCQVHSLRRVSDGLLPFHDDIT